MIIKKKTSEKLDHILCCDVTSKNVENIGFASLLMTTIVQKVAKIGSKQRSQPSRSEKVCKYQVIVQNQAHFLTLNY